MDHVIEGLGHTRRPWPVPLARDPVALAPTGSAAPEPIVDPVDPRWVLALHTAKGLQGALLDPGKRQRLLRLGRVLGLTPFEANLVIAIIQDQARRGLAPAQCPTAGQQQLEVIRPADRLAARQRCRRRTSAWVLAAALLLEVLWLLSWWR